MPGSAVAERGERVAAREELVAVRAGQPGCAEPRDEHVEQPAGAAVGVGDEDPVVGLAPSTAASTAAGIQSGGVVQVGREIDDVEWSAPSGSGRARHAARATSAPHATTSVRGAAISATGPTRRDERRRGLGRDRRVPAVRVGTDGRAELLVERRAADEHDEVVAPALLHQACR